MTETKESIEKSIKSFEQGNLTESGLILFQKLGYNTERQAPLDVPSFTDFQETYIKNNPNEIRFNPEKALTSDWKYIDILFQLSKEEILKQISLFDTKEFNKTIIESYLFITIELSNDKYNRTELANITREVNKLFSMPVMILFKHNETLTLSVINRRLHKRDESKDVLEKVTLIKDIRIKNTHRAHIEILFELALDNLKEKYNFTNFVELHNAWQKTLDTKELNKRFFKELSNWFFYSQGFVKFPNESKIEESKNNQLNLIRLITRLIFVWFLKEKNLVEEKLFDSKYIQEIIKDFDPNSEETKNYYLTILQNLFFATLNQKMGDRGFAIEGSFYENKEQHGVKNLYRYASLFNISENEVIKIFENIPFLNGGLFDCLDKENEETKKIEYIDGFSRNPKKVPIIPDFLLFGKERKVDLTSIYGTKKNKESFKGIIEIFKSYKFTIEENTPVEEEIALDPELLGKAFENLLAYYNPETATTARKQTGSFYTPREIVDYMVDESLIAYLKSQLLKTNPVYVKFGEVQTQLFRDEAENGQLIFTESINKSRWENKEDELENELRDLINYNNKPHLFSEPEVQQLIFAIDNCKILDPACGSGAFPMGILHKLVYLLSKLDPEDENGNTRWRELQKKKAQIDLIKALNEKDKLQREEKLIEINETFENNASDFGRKLFLIENCIYGVDIQPIAIQISKLRFFISLIVEQKEKPNSDNRGIKPLPNLETKFVAANTLIGLSGQMSLALANDEIVSLQKDLQEVRHQHFEAKTRKDKLNCQKIDKEIRKKTSNILISIGFPNNEANKISEFDIYEQNNSANWFEPKWMFGKDLENGFDIVIGNPPYGIINKKQNKAESIVISEDQIEYFKNSKDYKPALGGMINIFRLFIMKSILLLKKDGIFSEIFPLAFVGDLSIGKLREYILDNTNILFIEAFPERDNANKRVFEGVKMSVCILNLKKSKTDRNTFFIRINNDKYVDQSKEKNFLNKEIIETIDNKNYTFPLTSKIETDLLIKIFSKSLKFNSIGKCNTGEVDMTFYKDCFTQNKLDVPLLKGAIIDRYQLKDKMSQGEIVFINEKMLTNKKGLDIIDLKKSTRIVLQGITGVNESSRLKAMIIENAYCANSLNYLSLKKDNITLRGYLLGVLNSRLINFIFSKFSTNSNVNGYEIDNLPILIKETVLPVIKIIADYILISNENYYYNLRNKSIFFEKLIDAIVYELYLAEEIKSAECEVLKYLDDLPELKDEWSNEKKLEIIEKVYKELSNPKHPVSQAMFKMDTVEEIRIIEGKQ